MSEFLAKLSNLSRSSLLTRKEITNLLVFFAFISIFPFIKDSKTPCALLQLSGRDHPDCVQRS